MSQTGPLVSAENDLRPESKGTAMKYLMACLVSFLLTAIITPLIIRIATACKCVDVPGDRRVHAKTTPRWGGLAFFAGVLPVLFFVKAGSALSWALAASLLLVGIGIVDDLRELGWKTKLIGTVAAATLVIFGAHTAIHQIGVYGANVGWLSIPLTYVGIIGVTNAINLLDGLNGLAGGVSLLAFLFMGIAALFAGNVLVALVCFAFVGALGGFLLYNFPQAKIFMGDSGSIFLGFSLSLMAVLLTQSPGSPVNPLFPVLVLLLPIFDTLRVLFVRLVSGKNPFHADNLHLHYLILQKLSPLNAVLLLWSATAIAGGTALLMLGMSSAPYLSAVLYGSLVLAGLAGALTRRGTGQMPVHEKNGPRLLNPRNSLLPSVASVARGLQGSGVRARGSRRPTPDPARKPLKRSS